MNKSIKLISYNLFKGRVWWSGRSALNEMAELIQGYEPDLVFFQEIRGFVEEKKALRERFHQHLGLNHVYYGKNYVGKGNDHGNAIYARGEMLGAENFDLTVSKLERRGLVSSHCEPWGKADPLYLFCTHLDLSEGNRKKQLEKLGDRLEAILPRPSTPFILAGDFNDWRKGADRYLFERFGLAEAFRTRAGKLAKSFPSLYPMLELDRVYFRGLEVKEARVLSEGFRMLSDHLPLFVEFQR
ncbi:MAG: endonuclease/exonuclease/phosphatase family protein [Cryobacterium sp.]|nr:endonuclease/exonuclease/phosphatase family protein [Oligoflexia bacterium]